MARPSPLLRQLATGVVVVAAIVCVGLWYAWSVRHPWTRDGQVTANIVLLTPRVSGEVVEVAVVDNQRVSRGDLLFAIDRRAFENQVESARVQLDAAREQVLALEAAVGVAETNVETARTGITTATGNIKAGEAQVDSARSLVSSADAGLQSALATIDQRKAELDQSIRDRDRAARLAKEGAGSVSSAESTAAAADAAKAVLAVAEAGLDSAKASHDKANAGLKQAEATLIVTENGLLTAESQLASALADLRQAQANLGVAGEMNVQVRAAKASLADAELDLLWTEVRAPADGYVTNLVVEEGDYASTGQAMLAFVDVNSFYVQGFFRETQLRHMAIGDRAVVTLMGDRENPLEGTVESIGWAINPPDVASTGSAGDGTLVPQVEPSFDWIRLAQRVPVRIRLEPIADDVRLISGTTASVVIRPKE